MSWLDRFADWLAYRREVRHLRYMRKHMVCRSPPKPDDRSSLRAFRNIVGENNERSR
jgi:hypothetical protein